MTDSSNTNKFSIKELAIGMFVVCLIGFVFIWITFYFFVNNKKEEKQIVLKSVTIPEKIYNGVGGLGEPNSLDILEFNEDHSYTPSAEVFNNNYKKESKRLALFGKFLTAEFVIQGKTTNDKDNMLSINFGNLSGIYGISRQKNGEIIVDDSKAIFNKDNSLDIKINLMAQTRLSATLNELKNGITSGYKDLYLWQYIQPPPEPGTVVEFLFVPFSRDGTIGETTITNLEFLYRCEEKGECKVALCDENELGSECLENKIGKGTSKEYAKYFQRL